MQNTYECIQLIVTLSTTTKRAEYHQFPSCFTYESYCVSDIGLNIRAQFMYLSEPSRHSGPTGILVGLH